MQCKHGHIFEKAFSNLKSGQTHCPSCCASVGEERVANFLDLYDVDYRAEYTFEDLRGINGGLLRFDFALLDNNKNVIQLIEYDGEFHYGRKYKEDSHEYTQVHDKWKNEYCKKGNIPLLRISYLDFEHIEDILEEVVEDELKLRKRVEDEHTSD